MEPPFNKYIKCQVRNAHKSTTVGPMVSTTLGFISPFLTFVTPMLNQHLVLIKCNLKKVLIYCIPKSRDTMDHARSLSISVYTSESSEISCVQPKSHISFGISFKLCRWLPMAEIWQLYSFGRPGVKIMLRL